MKKYRNNIKLDHTQNFLRSFNLTQGIWLIYLAFKGFTLIEIGIFEAIFHLSSLTMEIPTGIVADLYGRKLSRIIGVIVYLLFLVLMVFGSSTLIIGIAFFLCGLSYTFESGSGEALIYDSMILSDNEKNYSKYLGTKEIIFQLSNAVALFIGGYIASQSYEMTFWIVFILFVVALIPILFMTETLEKRDLKHDKISALMYNHFKKSIDIVKNDKKLTFLIFTGSIMAAPVTTVFFYFQIHLKSIGYQIGLIGVLLGVHALASAVGGYMAKSLEKKYGEKLVLYIIPIFIVFSFWLILVESIVFIPFILLGFLDTIFYIVLNDYINQIIPSEQRATVLSMSGFSFSMVMIILFPVIGAVGDSFGLQISFVVQAIIVTVFLFILLKLISSNNIKIKE